MSVEALADLLARRLEEAGRSADPVVSVAELHRTLLPYHICRGSLGYASKAEYDLELLELLGSERYLLPAETELRAAVREERGSAEPGLGFLKNFAAAQVQIQSGLSVQQPVADEAGPAPRARRAEAGPPPASSPRVEPSAGPGEGGQCWRCGRGLPQRSGLRFCVFCGSDQRQPLCLGCDEELEPGWAYCPRCGKERAPRPDLDS